MPGYQLMQTIADRTGGAWRPSAGAIYPTLSLLEDEGLVTTEQDGGRRLASLTQAGQDFLAQQGETVGDPFAAFTQEGSGPDLRAALRDIQVAVRQLAMSGDETQVAAAASVLAKAKRDLYLTLAGTDEDDAES